MNVYQLAKLWLIAQGLTHQGDDDQEVLTPEQETLVRTRLGPQIGHPMPELWLLENTLRAELNTPVAEASTPPDSDDGDGDDGDGDDGGDDANDEGDTDDADSGDAPDGDDTGDTADGDEGDESGDNTDGDEVEDADDNQE